MKDKIEYRCETCKKKLTWKQLLNHYNSNHEVRCRGLLVIDKSKPIPYNEKLKGIIDTRTLITGIALTSAKAGDIVTVRI